MVEYSIQLNEIFSSLSDPIRRDMLRRLTVRELSISTLADAYDITFAAVSKHLKVLEKAKLVSKRKEGRSYIVALEMDTIEQADKHLEEYRLLWQQRHDKLDQLLRNN